MDRPYLESLIEARKSAIACLKAALENVTQTLQIVASLDNQIASFNSSHHQYPPENSVSTPSAATARPETIAASNEVSNCAAIGNVIRRAAETIVHMEKTSDAADCCSSARTSGYEARSLRLGIGNGSAAAAAVVVEPTTLQSKDKPQRAAPAAARESDTPTTTDTFASIHVKLEDAEKPDSTNVRNSAISSDVESMWSLDPLSLDESIQMLVDKQRNEDNASTCETRFQPMVRLEVLTEDDMKVRGNGVKTPKKKKSGRRGRRRKEPLTDDEEESKSREKKTRLAANCWTARRKRGRISSDEEGNASRRDSWPSRIQPKRIQSVKSPILDVEVEVKDEHEECNGELK